MSKPYVTDNQIKVTLPVPPLGEYAEVEFPRHGIKCLVERLPEQSQEQIRSRFAVVAPTEGNRLHVARVGLGVHKPKRVNVTACSENATQPMHSGVRIPGVPLDAVTCHGCRKKLIEAGVQLAPIESKEGP